MSNIQITENASGKYSPEWFYSESQTPEWISFAHKADELRENFINLFGIERLKSLSGKDLLTSLFYNDEGTKTNLCYILEMDKDIREVFGSISGGAAYKFGLFYHKKNQSWTCGSPLKPVLLTEAEAIQKADEMRNDLVEGAEIISSFGPLDSEEDYEQLYKQLEHIPGINMVWRMKYYQMLFPALFAPFYGQDIQLRVLHFLNQKPSDIPFIRMGQISLYARKCNVPGVVFAHIYGKNVGYTNETNDSDTNTLSDKKHKTHYWMYTVFDDKSWNECQQKGIMVLGMDDIGDYSQFASKEALRQELIDVYDSSTSRKNQALMAWNFANTVSVNDVIFAKRSNTLVGKGIVTGNYVFDDLRQEYKNVRAVKWLQVGEFTLLGDLTPELVHKLETGVILKGADTLTAPAKITVTGHAVMSDILSTLPEEIQKDIHKNRPDHPVTYGIITISEGKKRQIRRMMKSVHCCVIELKRISIGDIVLDKALCPGEWQEIFPHT